jgi:hypothetical protein
LAVNDHDDRERLLAAVDRTLGGEKTPSVSKNGPG